MDDRRLLLVHAHPDDEASMTGATMVSNARQGVTVVLGTCTRGELGEIVAPDLARHHWLGGHGRWRDSGIPANEDPAAFAHADSDTLSRRMIQNAMGAGLLSDLPAIPGSLPDEEITAVVDGRDYLEAKVAALGAHRSQVDLENGLLAVLAKVPEFAVES